MSHRPLSSFRARLAAGSAGLLAAAGLLVACVDPRPTGPVGPPPMAEAEQPELYGGPEGAPGDVYAEAQPEPMPQPGMEGQPLPPEPMLEARRPGWGTMEPIPNPPGSPATERGRAYAEAAPPPADGRPSEQDRLGAYAPPGALPSVPPPEVYAERYETPEPYAPPPPVEAPYAEGQPASSYPSTVVTMPPIPNPVETRPAPRVRDVIGRGAERRAEAQPRP
ncbi:MAG: hypothetical protein M3M95_04820, partial [Pseudomonadota bacterium]|nr:hypothetical protein [Pseudomonadota bacterium]